MHFNFRLPSRAACIVTDCIQTCLGFVAENPDGTPKYFVRCMFFHLLALNDLIQDFDNPETICFSCGHPYLVHTIQFSDLTEQNKMFARGGTSDGRCASFWSPVPVAASSTASSVIVPHRPVVAFTGLARPSTASVQQARQASIQRNLHGLGSGSSALTPTSPPKKKRKSGPPRSYTDTPASTSSTALNDFAVTSAPTSATIWCGILPKVLDSSDFNDPLDLSPRLFWKSAEEIENAQLTLKNARLVFTVDVSTTGPIFEAIELGFQNHCATNNIDYIAPTVNAAVPSPNTMSYVLLGPRGRSNGRTWIEDPKSLTRFTFTLQALRSAPYSHTPNNLGDGVFHPATAIYLPQSTVFLGLPAASPITFCRTVALGSVSSTLSFLLLVAIPIPKLSPSLFLSNPLKFLQPRSYLGPMAPVDLTLQHMPGSGPCNLVAWQNHLLGPRDMDDHIVITASSVDEGARALITLCFWLCSHPTNLKLKEVLTEQFASPRPKIDNAHLGNKGLFGLRARIGPGIGRGPRNEVVAEALKILFADGRFWTEREGYLTLRLHPSCTPIPYRFCISKATGLIFLLHFLFIGAPLPASPFLFLTLFDGRAIASKFDVDFLSTFISHTSLGLIKRIVGGPLDAPLYSSQGEFCEEYQYLVNIPGLDPSMISTPRSKEEQRGVAETVVSFTTLGCVDIEHHPDFLGTSDGFNVIVEPFGGQTRRHHILEWFATPCIELIKATFDRQVKSGVDIFRFLDFVETNPEDDPWGDNIETVGLISRFFFHYLLESGHPRDSNNVISALVDSDTTLAATDSVLRARLFLAVATGSTLLPVKPTGYKIKCLVTHDHSEDYPTVDEDGNDDFGPDVVINFQSCFQTFTLTNNARLRHLLISENPEEGKDTAFGRAFHAQLLVAYNFYTSQ
ncbi:hypothetical protein R3P38DRAFT_3316325 [Favolaschia claudopus]|uniref:Uncharacterized protein n=1 Tax=Favolaschia claudopus TaxID=2862362 RepID=A0AAW0BK47_9AGAR